MCKSPAEGLAAGPLGPDDLFKWEALIAGPEGTPYEFGVFRALLTFPSEYPMQPVGAAQSCFICSAGGCCY